jgi:hypothetical protein
MFLPTAQRGWIVAVLISLALVLVAALVTNQIAFRNRFGNALLKTVLHAVLFGAAGLAFVYFAKTTPTPSITAFIIERTVDLIWPVAFGAILVFCAMILANLVTFRDRSANTVATGLVFAILYGGVVYALDKVPLGGNLVDLLFL